MKRDKHDYGISKDSWELNDYKRLGIIKPSDKYWAWLTVAVVALSFWFLRK